VYQLDSSLAQVKAIKTTWLLLCACFALATICLPAYSAHDMLPNVPMGEASMAAEMVMHDGIHQSLTSKQGHPAGYLSSPTCDEPGCDSMSECADDCTMNTCCSSPGVYIARSNLVQIMHRYESIHRLTSHSSVLFRQSEPLFRPPIS